MTNCTKCKKDYNGNYCPNCGSSKSLPRIDFQFITNEIRSIANFEKGFLYTTRELILRPDKTIKQFIEDDRTIIVKPILFLIICSIIFALFNQVESLKNTDDSGVGMLFQFWQDYPGYSNIIIVFFTSIWVIVFFKKYKYNFFEILVLLSYIAGVQVLIVSVFEAIEFFFGFKIPFNPILISFIYSGWVIGRFFNKRKVITYFLGYLSQILGTVFFLLSLFGLGELIDLIKNYYR